MDRIQVAAEISIGRAVGFGALAIGTVVVGLVFDPVLAFKTGGALTLLMAAILQLKAERALPALSIHRGLAASGPTAGPAHAQRIVSTVLRAVYQRHAGASFAVAVGFWMLALALQLFS